MSQHQEISDMIDKAASDLDATEESLIGRRGPAEDAIKALIPMQRSNLEIMRAFLRASDVPTLFGGLVE